MRWLAFLVILIAILSSIFHIVFNKAIKVLTLEATNIKTVKEASNSTVFVFKRKDNLEWILKGKRVEFPSDEKTLFVKFKAKNIPQNFTVSSEEALFFFKKEKVLLTGNVTILFTKNGKIYTIQTPKALVDLKKHLIVGNQGVKLVSSGRLLTGQRFYYDYRNGTFAVEGNVTTIIINK